MLTAHPGIGVGALDHCRLRLPGVTASPSPTRLRNQQVSGDIHLGALVCLPVVGQYFPDINFPVRFDRKRQLFHVCIQIQVGCHRTQDEQLSGRVGFPTTVGFPEPERFAAGGIPPAHLLGQYVHIVGSHEVIGIIQIEPADPGYIGRYPDMIIRDAHRCPYRTCLQRTCAHDLELPDLFRIGEGQAFTVVSVAVLLDQFAYQLNGFPGRGATFQNDFLQLLYQEKAVLIDQDAASADRRFADGKLFLVHAGIGHIHVGVSFGHFRDFTLHT